MTEKKTYRYPGVQPFRTQDSDIFFGRDDDCNRLSKLIMLEKLVVLFGKSGQGKSSLINAGIIPVLKDKDTLDRFHYFPIEVRIGKVSGQDILPVQKVIIKLNEQFPDLPEWNFLDDYKQAPQLWQHFKKKQSANTSKFLLIFDQFEEFFNYSNEEQQRFRWELAELLYTDIPQGIRENIDEITDEQYHLLSTRLDIKILISIRSDRLSLIHSMKDALPRILDSRFEIKGLNVNQAKEAIKLPALLRDVKFVTHPFSYDNNTLNIILKELTSLQSDGSESIETFQLQIICQGCESKIEEKMMRKEIDIEVNEEDLPDFENLYDKYYQRQIERLPVKIRDKAQILLEENLVYEDEQTGEYRRLSVDGNILRKQILNLGLKDDILNLLEDAFLIRREVNNVGGFSYEISHDAIVYPIIKIKEERKIQEIKSRVVKRVTRKVRKQTAWLLLGICVLIIGGLKWKTIYFGSLELAGQKTKPIIRLEKKLTGIVNHQKNEILQEARKIDTNYFWGSWTASQIMTGIKDVLTDTIKQNYFNLTAGTIDTSCCCWKEIINIKDIRTTGWILSTVGSLRMIKKYDCKLIDFFINNQLQDGSWSMLPIDTTLTEYGSTYATCQVLRALHNSLPELQDDPIQMKINTAIDRGAKWLLYNRSDTTKPIWVDYPNNTRREASASISISGLVIHTLNLIQYATPNLNQQWLRNLKMSQSGNPINNRELNDVFYFLNPKKPKEATHRDATRHLIIPWQIIATIDAYKDGIFSEKLKANIWIDNVINNLDDREIDENQVFIIAEIFIALRYLQDKEYIFQ